jgi:hypothetical protein
LLHDLKFLRLPLPKPLLAVGFPDPVSIASQHCDGWSALQARAKRFGSSSELQHFEQNASEKTGE